MEGVDPRQLQVSDRVMLFLISYAINRLYKPLPNKIPILLNCRKLPNSVPSATSTRSDAGNVVTLVPMRETLQSVSKLFFVIRRFQGDRAQCRNTSSDPK